MIKIGTKKVNKIMVGNKEVLKVIEGDGTSTGILKYQAGSTPIPTLPRYVIGGRFGNSNYTEWEAYDIEDPTGTPLAQGNINTAISGRGTGIYALEFNNILNSSFMNNVMQAAGAHNNRAWILKEIRVYQVCYTQGFNSTLYLQFKDTSSTIMKTIDGNKGRWYTQNPNTWIIQQKNISMYDLVGDPGYIHIDGLNIDYTTLNSYTLYFEGYSDSTFTTYSNKLTMPNNPNTMVTIELAFDIVE